MTGSYLVPAGPARIEIEIARSRFIASLARTATADQAREFIHSIRLSMPDANHHVYGFRAGYPPSVTEGMSDAGEPAGTAGPPVLAVVRGSDKGDLTVVVTRYFGGTKLGTGGLVRAYTEAAQTVLAEGRYELKRDLLTVGIEIPYSLFELCRRAVLAQGAEIMDQQFEAAVTLTVSLQRPSLPALELTLSDLTAGSAQLVLLD